MTGPEWWQKNAVSHSYTQTHADIHVHTQTHSNLNMILNLLLPWEIKLNPEEAEISWPLAPYMVQALKNWVLHFPQSNSTAYFGKTVLPLLELMDGREGKGWCVIAELVMWGFKYYALTILTLYPLNPLFKMCYSSNVYSGDVTWVIFSVLTKLPPEAQMMLYNCFHRLCCFICDE